MKNNKRNSGAAPIVVPKRLVRIMASDLFRETVTKYKGNAAVQTAMADFIEFKRANPLVPYGSKDRPFKHDPLKGIYHAGLTFDVSVLYTISGNNPNIITLYGIYSHDETGTGTPRNSKRQKQVHSRITNTGGIAPLTPLDEQVG